MSLNLDKSLWKRVRFGEVADRYREQMSQADDSIERYVAGNHFENDALEVIRYGTPDDGGMGSTFTYAFHPGHVLYVSASWYLRKVGVATFDGVVADKTYVIETRNPEILDQRFLPWILLSDELYNYAAAQATGSMNARLLWSTLSNFEFNLPPLHEQKRLADLLWAVEEHRKELNQLSKQIEDARLGSFKSWIEENKHWQPLSEQFDVQLGKMLSSKSKPDESDEGYPYLANINVRWKSFDLTELRTVKLTENEKRKFRLIRGDILICEGGEIGRSAIWDDALEECYYQKALHRLRPKIEETIPAEIVVEYMHFLASEEKLAPHSTGTTFSHLTRERLMELKVPVASSVNVTKMAEKLNAYSSVAEKNYAEIQQLQSLNLSLLATIFGGSQ